MSEEEKLNAINKAQSELEEENKENRRKFELNQKGAMLPYLNDKYLALVSIVKDLFKN